jgi:hypothetical protein
VTPLPPAYLTRIGPIDRRDGASSAIYLAIAPDGERLANRTESPPNDAAAIRGLAATVTTHAPRCALELAEVGAQLGFDVGELPPRAAEERAAAAYLASAPDHLLVTPEAVRELCTAAADYMRARPWTKLAILRRFRAKETIRTSNGAVLRVGELLLQVHAGHGPDGPRLHVEIEGDSWRSPSASSPFRVQVTLASDPAWVADAVDGAYGAHVCPRIAYMEAESLGVPEDSHALLLAAAMRAAVDRMRGGAGRGRASSGSFAFELEADFATSVPLAPLPTGEDALDLRVIGRLMAHSLATQVPLPYYDDYVCVVLDRDDPQTETAMDQLDVTAAMVGDSLPDGFTQVYKTGVSVEHFVARWMRAEHMAEMLAHNPLPEDWIAPLHADLPPFALRVLLFGSHQCEALFVDFSPRKVEIQREKVRDQARLRETEGAEGEDATEEPSGEPREIAGTWRDGLAYLPKALPGNWSVGERRANGAVTIAAGPLSVVLTAEREDRRRWVRVYFGEHPEGRPVTREEARGVYEKLVGCGRFSEMSLVARDAERVCLAGARLFAAPLATARPRSAVRSRTPGETAALVERAKVHLGEVIARVRDERGLLRDYCVLLDAKGPLGDKDGVIMTRDLIERIFATPESDPFHIRARFEEPRPADECVVFVKHPDGIEEIHVSLESVQRTPELEA